MTYWNEIVDIHVPLYSTEPYKKSKSFREYINDEGSMGDTLTTSDVIFVGSCDIMSGVGDLSLHWSKKIHASLHSSSPYITLGVTAGGLPTIVRKLYSYISNFGAPKYVYLTVPRFDGYEYVNKSGKCYNASSNVETVNFSLKNNIVNKDEADTWLMQLQSNELLRNIHNNQYILEERFAFIETICKLHNIKLKWTFNTSGPSIRVLYENLSCFENISKFMKESFVGIPTIKDMLRDYSIGPETQMEIVNKFMNSESWNYNNFCQQATQNHEWFMNYNNLPKETTIKI